MFHINIFIVLLLNIIIHVFSTLDNDNANTLLSMARKLRNKNTRSDTNKAIKIYTDIIENSIDTAHVDALYELSMILEVYADNNYLNMYGGASPTNQMDMTDYSYDVVLELLIQAAEEGHPDAQHEVAAIYNTGIYSGLVPMDATRSLLLEYMSSLSGNPEAHIGMGYRYLHGLGVKPSCDRALIHYEYAANEVIRQISSDSVGSGGISGVGGTYGDELYDTPTRPNRYHHSTASRAKLVPVHVELSKLSDTFMSGSGNNGVGGGKPAEFDHSVSNTYI